jgi:heptosyltransferase-1
MNKILLVKTSSMGDVIHNLPVISDILQRQPSAQIDWVVEDSFADIPCLHSAVHRVIPVALRRWRRHWYRPGTWSEIHRFKHELQKESYNVVLDTQGLLKSAWIAHWAKGMRYGPDRKSAREYLAACFYDQTFCIERQLHAVMRNRLLASHALGYSFEPDVTYGIQAPSRHFDWLTQQSYVVLLHATSRDDKLWPESNWQAVGGYFTSLNKACVLPWGNALERDRAQRLVKHCNGIVPPLLTMGEMAALLSRAWMVVGVDTGLAHLAAALHAPTVALYCSTSPELTGLYGASKTANLGSPGRPPSVAQVISTAQTLAHVH